jgi:rubrerythrin
MAHHSAYALSNLEFDIVTTLSNLMQGREALDKYAKDAQQAGDQETAEIFRTIQTNNDAAAERLRNALSRVIQQAD